MVELETDPAILAFYSNDQWEALLKAATVLPRPRGLIIVRSLERAPRPDFRPDSISPPDYGKRNPALDDRRLYILRRLRDGAKKNTVAQELGVSNGLISKILKGERR